MSMSQKAIKAQQDLSNKFGIPTFNKSGGISTVPTSGKINTKINVGLGSFKTTSSLNRAVQAKISSQTASKKPIDNKKTISTPASKPSSVFTPTQPKIPAILSKATINAQQKLSDKFGIPTFNITGGISTVPKSGEFQPIDVGLGGFKDEDSFIDAIVSKYPSGGTLGATASGIGDTINNFFTELFATPPQDTTTGQNIQDTPSGLSDEASKTIDSPELLFGGSGGVSGDKLTMTGEEEAGFFDDFFSNPLKLGLGVVAVIGLILATGGKRR